MNQPLKSIIVTTSHRGVWFAEVDPAQDLTNTTLTNLKNCRMAIKWGTTRGVHQLAETGPTEKSKISATADIPVLHGVTALFTVTPKAVEAWKKIKG